NAEGCHTLDVEQYNKSYQGTLARDKQNRPYLYRPSHGNIGDLYLFVVGKFKNLISGKSKKGQKVLPDDITVDDLKKLFTDDPLFNEELLQKNLKNPPKKTYLFFVYCEDQHLDRDRKSTRLNSSHVSISYAVFCLKKKK